MTGRQQEPEFVDLDRERHQHEPTDLHDWGMREQLGVCETAAQLARPLEARMGNETPL